MNVGRLLVATPLLMDPNFTRTVVFVFSVQQGAAGVVLNRPSDIPVTAVLPHWTDAAAEPAVLHLGGPVAAEHAVALGLGPGHEMVTETIGIVDLDGDPSDVAPGSIRLFAGYAGWGPGQLEDEVAEGSWFVVEPTDSDLIGASPRSLWRTVLQRQEPALRRYADYPDDPSLN